MTSAAGRYRPTILDDIAASCGEEVAANVYVSEAGLTTDDGVVHHVSFVFVGHPGTGGLLWLAFEPYLITRWT